MTRTMVSSCAAAMLLSLSAVGIARQEKSCGDPSRHAEAIRIAGQINSRQTAAFKNAGSYSRERMQLTAPEGFVVRIINGDDLASYMVVIKDTQNPCGAVVFTDQDQVIYTAMPIQPARQP